MSSELDQLHEQLEEKDAIVAALTARLERAAEQLDRLHRLGVDRALINCATTPAPPPPPKKPAAKTDPLHEDLDRLIQQWDALQANNSFGRIEIQIGEVRDLIVQLSQNVREQQVVVQQVPVPLQPVEPAAPAANPIPDAMGGRADVEDAHIELPDQLFQQPAPGINPAEKYASGGGLSDWNSIKQNLLSGGDSPGGTLQQPAPMEPVAPAEVTEAAQKEAEESAFLAQLAELIPEGLKDIDLNEASHSEIARAIEERDEYISRLLNYITAVHKLDMKWDIIAEGPAVLQERLVNLQHQLEAKLRLAEVSIAVERAKLGRDEMRIRQLEANAQRILKRLGVDPSDPESMKKVEKMDSNSPPRGPGDVAAGGNWRRLLGLGKEDETE